MRGDRKALLENEAMHRKLDLHDHSEGRSRSRGSVARAKAEPAAAGKL